MEQVFRVWNTLLFKHHPNHWTGLGHWSFETYFEPETSFTNMENIIIKITNYSNNGKEILNNTTKNID